MKEPTDEQLLDYWLVFGPEGSIEISEGTARGILAIVDQPSSTYRPALHHFQDLFGGDVWLDLSTVYMIAHNTPAWREQQRRQQTLFAAEEPKEF